MKKIITLFSLALLSLLCGDDLSSMLSPAPRSVEINSKNSLTIPLKSTNVEIVTAKDALNITCFAAEELQKFLQQVLDTRIPVVNAPTPGKISFIVGLNAWSKASGIDTKKLTPEAFFIKRSGNRIYIAGRDGKLLNRLHGLNKNTRPESSAARTLQGGYWSQFHEHATLFGVYEFLERFAVRKSKAVIFPGNIASQKAFEHAGFYHHHSHEDGTALYYVYECLEKEYYAGAGEKYCIRE